VLALPLPTACPEPCNKPPFSASPRSLDLVLGAGGQTCHMESQEFGPWVQNSTFITSSARGEKQQGEAGWFTVSG
jgi:hypothetical protein